MYIELLQCGGYMYVLCIMYIDLYRMYINKMGPFTSDGDT